MAGEDASKARRPKIILVTDSAYGDEHIVEAVEACVSALPPGSFAVQLRDKKKEPSALRALAEKLRAVTKPGADGRGGALFLVNGHLELARDVGADGVHLGGTAIKVSDARGVVGAKAFVTIAAHSDEAVRLGAQDGADGALVSAIFASPGKAAGRGVGARGGRGRLPHLRVGRSRPLECPRMRDGWRGWRRRDSCATPRPRPRRGSARHLREPARNLSAIHECPRATCTKDRVHAHADVRRNPPHHDRDSDHPRRARSSHPPERPYPERPR